MSDALQTVLNDIATAKGLPNAHYIDADMYAKERETIFFNSWTAIGFASDAPAPACVYPVDFMGMPLIIVRGKDNAVRVFQNTCRHRGMILVDKPGTLKGPIRCPYHSWCYDLKGALVRTPYVGGVDIDTHADVDPATLGLFEIRSHVWHGTVFVNVSGNAPDFAVAHKDILTRWAEFDKPYFVPSDSCRFSMTVKTNWKLAIENYCESYHLPWIHPELNEISNINDHYNIDEHEGYAGQGSLKYRQLVGEGGRKFPDFDGVGSRWDTLSEYASWFPNMLTGVHRDFAFSVVLIPQGPEETLERAAMFYAQDLSADYEPMIAENARIWRDIFMEDLGVVEGMQRGRHGPKFDGGKFSPVMDGPTHNFHKWVARRMLAAGS